MDPLVKIERQIQQLTREGDSLSVLEVTRTRDEIIRPAWEAVEELRTAASALDKYRDTRGLNEFSPRVNGLLDNVRTALVKLKERR